jgi:hypothetical protein
MIFIGSPIAFAVSVLAVRRQRFGMPARIGLLLSGLTLVFLIGSFAMSFLVSS